MTGCIFRLQVYDNIFCLFLSNRISKFNFLIKPILFSFVIKKLKQTKFKLLLIPKNMKKIISSFILIIVFGLSAFSQINIKPSVGINTSLLKSDFSGFESEGKIGYQFGASVLIGDKFYVEPGLYYSTVYSEIIVGEIGEVNIDNKMSSLRLPVYLGYHIFGNSSETLANLRVFAGPSIAIITTIDESSGLTKEDFSSALWGLDAGIGFNVGWLFMDFGYEWALNNALKNEDISNIKFNSLWANIGFRVRL